MLKIIHRYNAKDWDFTYEVNYLLSNTYLLFLSYLLSSRMTCNKYKDTGSDYINKTLNSIDPLS